MDIDKNPKLNLQNTSLKISSVEIQTHSRTKPIAHIYDGEYFEVVMQDDNLLIVRCKICGPDGPHLRTSTKSNGNILKHIQRRHANMLNKIKLEKNIKSRMSRFEIRRDRSQNIDDANLLEEESIYIEHTDQTEPNATETKSITEHYEINDNHEVENSINVNQTDPELVATTIQYPFTNQDTKYDNYNDKAIDEVSETEGSEYQHTHYEGHNVLESNNRIVANNTDTSSIHLDKELIELRKELMKREYEEMHAMRLEKHKAEMDILKAELQHKSEVHKKQMELLDQRIKRKLV